MNALLLKILLVLILVISSSLAVVYAKHQSRKLFTELQSLKKQQDQLDIEWGKLQLEQSAWARHERIERIAGKQLDMKIPGPEDIVVIRP
jgi:cell division protein FtsL